AGTKHVKARQWVNGTPSDPGNQHEFVVGAFAKPPKPLILSPEQGDKYPVGPLMVIGSCLSGATVEVLNWDNSKLGDATVTGTIWTYSRVWDAGTKHVKARQWVNGTPSDPGNQHEFVVGAFAKPPKPLILSPEQGDKYPVGPLMVIGSCLSGATVEVLNWDNSKLGDATVTGTIWTYSRVWDAGTKHVKARQWVNGTPSDPGNQHEFVVGAFAKPPKPLILSPEQGDKYPVGPLMVIGSCLSGATVEVLNWDNSKLGDATVTGTIWTYSRVWDAGTKHVKARQWVNGTPSDPGNQHEFVVGAFAKPPKPLILSPEQGDKYPVGPLMVIGSCLSGATVEVLNWDNSKLGDATVTGTIWTYSRVWDAGTKHVKARQTVRGVASDPSAQCEFFIVEMTQPPVPEINEPQQGSIHPVGNVRIRGTCLKGAIVDVLNWDDSVLAVATVNGTIWTLDYIWQTGFKHVKARQTLNHWRSDPSPEREFIVGIPGKPPAPEITEPAPGSKHPVGNVKIKGTCLARSTVEVLSWDGTKLADAVVGGTTWELDYTWDTGVKHVKARQTEYGKVSDPSREVEFTVGTPANPPAPKITEPQPGSTHPTGRLTIEGTCLARATVEVLYPNDSKLGDAVIHGTNWFFDSTWDAGVKGIKARQTEYGRVSEPSITCSFKVKPSKPTILKP
ncbi:hypothetical protein, partial [Pseudomonas fluorescens]|uniref:hypothetical protein n=1 Tax=Pseudomonas fluorescens TaxID=294 RepID=UPI00177EA97F